jgi:hypothetical protein
MLNYSYQENNFLSHNNIEYDLLSDSFNPDCPYLNGQSQDISNFINIEDYPGFNINKNNKINFKDFDLKVDLSNINKESENLEQDEKKYSIENIRNIKKKYLISLNIYISIF